MKKQFFKKKNQKNWIEIEKVIFIRTFDKALPSDRVPNRTFELALLDTSQQVREDRVPTEHLDPTKVFFYNDKVYAGKSKMAFILGVLSRISDTSTTGPVDRFG